MEAVKKHSSQNRLHRRRSRIDVLQAAQNVAVAKPRVLQPDRQIQGSIDAQIALRHCTAAGHGRFNLLHRRITVDRSAPSARS